MQDVAYFVNNTGTSTSELSLTWSNFRLPHATGTLLINQCNIMCKSCTSHSLWWDMILQLLLMIGRSAIFNHKLLMMCRWMAQISSGVPPAFWFFSSKFSTKCCGHKTAKPVHVRNLTGIGKFTLYLASDYEELKTVWRTCLCIWAGRHLQGALEKVGQAKASGFRFKAQIKQVGFRIDYVWAGQKHLAYCTFPPQAVQASPKHSFESCKIPHKFSSVQK